MRVQRVARGRLRQVVAGVSAREKQSRFAKDRREQSQVVRKDG